jgi:hypothetical protein
MISSVTRLRLSHNFQTLAGTAADVRRLSRTVPVAVPCMPGPGIDVAGLLEGQPACAAAQKPRSGDARKCLIMLAPSSND